MPIKIPEKVKVLLDGGRVKVEGPLGKMDVPADPPFGDQDRRR
jgi:ribosomal protein L6P/L9E